MALYRINYWINLDINIFYQDDKHSLRVTVKDSTGVALKTRHDIEKHRKRTRASTEWSKSTSLEKHYCYYLRRVHKTFKWEMAGPTANSPENNMQQTLEFPSSSNPTATLIQFNRKTTIFSDPHQNN